MARQLEDTQTLDLLPIPKRRGRPKTGRAMTPAQKQAAYRRRKKQIGLAAIELDRADVALLISALESRAAELHRTQTATLFENETLIAALCLKLSKLHE